ncbi:hypothetical protein [Mucilaginibacter arboris]|uniref:DUF1440 domain-containing protein n=1 Tax=Mucilaginibacter arboris TaxID=2682090 RepID=A0A7K1T1F8_9SPHI|nr:hypothetical protein [Mucilaginibacter arboris]MVN23405.1 hypothetical protein [Mucilaginibacter arboris]
MKTGTALIGGLAGAVTLNLIHEAYRQIDKDAPHIHIIGEEALVKVLKEAKLPKPHTQKQLYLWTLTGDVISNALYYSLIGAGKRKNLLKRGLAFGLAAGLGAVFMPSKMSLADAPSARTTETKLLTVLWYTLGGLAAASVIKVLRKKKSYAIKSVFHAKPDLYKHTAQL